MINFYCYENGILKQCDAPKAGCWVSVVDPIPQEVTASIQAAKRMVAKNACICLWDVVSYAPFHLNRVEQGDL